MVSDMAFTLKNLNVKLFTDGADKAQILEMAKQPWIRGFTTNPSLMKAAKVSTTGPMPANSWKRCRIVISPSRCFPTTFRKWSRRRV